jgi:hypothetical protein
MKKLLTTISLLALLFCLGTPAHAQETLQLQLKITTAGAHNVVLNWVASADAALNPTLGYQVYRTAGLSTVCPAVPPSTVAAALASGFVVISGATPITAVTYTDLGFPNAPLPPGNYCYFVASVLSGASSLPSNLAPAPVLPAPPTGLVPTPS